MLIANNSKIRIEIDIDLVYDDDTQRKCTIKPGDLVKLTYRCHSIEKVTHTGRILRIIQEKKPTHIKHAVDKVFLQMDFSDKYSSKVVSVNLYDIIDVIVIEEPLVEKIEPEESIPDIIEPEEV